MIDNKKDALLFLEKHNIRYKLSEHEAVFTVEQSKNVKTGLSGIGTKNLFLRDKKGTRMFLVVVEKDKKVDIKQLAVCMDTDRLSFGSAERLEKNLGVKPGSVSIMAIMNDAEKAVELFIDEDVWNAELVTCHPMINTTTVELTHESVKMFLDCIGRKGKIIKIPLQSN